MNTFCRSVVGIGLCLLLCGCAHRTSRGRGGGGTSEAGAAAVQAVYREDAPRPARPAAAALVFAPPVLQDAPAPELSRDGRRPAAFVGYPEGVAEFFYVRWDDRQAGGAGYGGFGRRGGWGGGSRDRYERRAISEKVGVLYR